jgi:hypothetical protein
MEVVEGKQQVDQRELEYCKQTTGEFHLMLVVQVVLGLLLKHHQQLRMVEQEVEQEVALQQLIQDLLEVQEEDQMLEI